MMFRSAKINVEKLGISIMSDTIDYYYTTVSPFAYLGHKPLMKIAEKYKKQVNFKPFNLGGVWQVSGSQPLAERSATRQRYRLIELQRIAIMRDTKINIQPDFFPTDPTRADQCICALVLNKENPAKFSQEAGRAVWERNLQISDENILLQLLKECGHNADEILQLSSESRVADMRQKNTEDAVTNDAIGAPAYVYNGEVFWGQDRLEYLEQMIASGRKAFQV